MLCGRISLVTGVSRRQGTGFAVTRRPAMMGSNLFLIRFQPHDALQPWGADALPTLLAEPKDDVPAGTAIADMGTASTKLWPIRRSSRPQSSGLGHLGILVCSHAHSGRDSSSLELDAESLDERWRVNACATSLLTRAFARHYDRRPGGQVI